MSTSVQKYRSTTPKVSIEDFSDRIRNITFLQRSYLAGVIDGEGSFGLYLSKTHKSSLNRLTIITNTNKDLIEYVESLVGTEFTHWRGATETRESCAVIFLSHRDLLEVFIPAVLPFLVAKRKQAKLLLEFIRQRVQEGQHALTNEQKQLANTFKEMNGAKSRRYRYDI